MKIRLQYASDVAVLPASALTVMGRATAIDLRVLLVLCHNAAMREDTEAHMPALCEQAGCTEAQAHAALAFWRGADVLSVEDTAEETAVAAPVPAAGQNAPETQVKTAPLKKSDSLPKYTTEELTALLEKRKETAALIDECQRILGKLFNTHEISILVGLLDYLALDAEYPELRLAKHKGYPTKEHYAALNAYIDAHGGEIPPIYRRSFLKNLHRE